MNLEDAEKFRFGTTKKILVAGIARKDNWIAYLPVNNREYMLIREWREPFGFVVAILMLDCMAYTGEEFFEEYKDALAEFCERIALPNTPTTAV